MFTGPLALLVALGATLGPSLVTAAQPGGVGGAPTGVSAGPCPGPLSEAGGPWRPGQPIPDSMAPTEGPAALPVPGAPSLGPLGPGALAVPAAVSVPSSLAITPDPDSAAPGEPIAVDAPRDKVDSGAPGADPRPVAGDGLRPREVPAGSVEQPAEPR